MALILGTKIIEHDACFALFEDDKPIFVYEQERFNRQKHGFTYAIDGLTEALQTHGISVDDIDFVSNSLDAELVKQRKNLFIDAYGREYVSDANLFCNSTYEKAIQYKNKLLSLGFRENQIVSVRHHLGHCSAVYYPSPYNDAAILSVDGGGEMETCVLAHGQGKKIQILESVSYPHSLGHLYEAVTRWLGLNFGEEGKTMALASYGTPKYYEIILKELLSIDSRGIFQFKIPFWGYREDSVFTQLFGQKRQSHESITQKHKDVAATIQSIAEDIVLKLAENLKYQTQSETLLITGGGGLNSVANGKIASAGLFKNVSAYPQANDAGIAMGGALHVNYHIVGNNRQNYWIMDNAFLGKEIDSVNVEDLSDEYHLPYTRHNNIEEVVAGYIAQNKIVAWVQGREEVGPRALGNRSILANPLYPEMKLLINERVKSRETWCPLASSVLEEDADTFFELNMPMPFMNMTSTVKDAWKEKLAAISHVDHTAQVQTVNENQIPIYYRLLKCVKEKIGIGMVVNTSFNVKGEPLVQNGRQAIEDFLRTEIDVLVIGNYLFDKGKIKREGVVEPFTPFTSNIEKLVTASIRCLGIHIDNGYELNPVVSEGLVKRGIGYHYIDIKDKRQTANENLNAFLIVLNKNPILIDHSQDSSFIQILHHAHKLQTRTKKTVFFEIDGDVFNFDDCAFLLNRYQVRQRRMRDVLPCKPYVVAPKDRRVSDDLVESVSGFLFERESARDQFLFLNENNPSIIKKVYLIQQILQMGATFVVHDHPLYSSMNQKILTMGGEKNFFYSQWEDDNDLNTLLYVHDEQDVEQRTQCPVCGEAVFSHILRAFSKPDDTKQFRWVEGDYLICEKCGTLIKAPLELYQKSVSTYGKIYYDQMLQEGSSIETVLHNHVIYSQIPCYETCKDFLLQHFDPESYGSWLDVGSAGVPTSFEEYEFSTIEPDPRTVTFGRRFFNSSKIECNILEEYETDRVYDGILFHHSFYCLSTPNKALDRAKRFLKEDGVIVVAIGHFSMETPSVFEDNFFSRLEDIFRGETLNVYYNPYSLKYFFQKHGFECIADTILNHRYHPHNTNYSSRYFAFRRRRSIPLCHGLLQESKRYHMRKLIDLFDLWKQNTLGTLKKFDTQDSVIVGDFRLFKFLQKLHPMTNIKGFVDLAHNQNVGYQLDGACCLSFDEFKSLENKKIIICSFNQQQKILEILQCVNNTNEIYMPTRTSSIDNLWFEFRGHNYLTKEFTLKEVL